MPTFSNTYGPSAMMASVAEMVRSVELARNGTDPSDLDVHTITLVLSGQHGEFDLVVEATDMETMEEHRFEGVAHRHGGVAGFAEVKV